MDHVAFIMLSSAHEGTRLGLADGAEKGHCGNFVPSARMRHEHKPVKEKQIMEKYRSMLMQTANIDRYACTFSFRAFLRSSKRIPLPFTLAS
jgi:hypothetical protein